MIGYADVLAIYDASDGEATKALYARLEQLGAVGFIATNLFRAQKSSSRAKVYRGGRYRRAAYDRKQWAMINLANALVENASGLGMRWGWGIDETQPRRSTVLYIDLPTGQVSFHTEARGPGPDYPAEWDGAVGTAPTRICRWIGELLA